MMYHNKRFAFTLAEVLITLGIIGIVAAMTLPSLIQKHKEKVLINQLKVVYNQLDNAFNYAISENGPINTWSDKANINAYYDSFVIENLNVVKTCKRNSSPVEANRCWGNPYSMRDGRYISMGISRQSFVLANGTSIIFSGNNGDNVDSTWCSKSKSSSGTERYLGNCGTITVDVNGKKPPNQYGVDLHQFNIFQDGIDLQGKQVDRVSGLSFTNGCLQKLYGGGSISCSAWVIINNNMDYLHCDDLSWDGKNKCD